MDNIIITRTSLTVKAKKWRNSFDHLLDDEDGIEAFAHFLKSEYSDENIKFWLACEEFKKLENQMEEKAKWIYDSFVSRKAKTEVNLDSKTKRHIKKSMETINSHIFDQGQRSVRDLMATDSYPRFLKSSTYKRLLALDDCSIEQET